MIIEIALGIGFVVELALSMYLLKVVHRHELDIYNRELKIEVLQHDIDTYNESIKVLSGSVRKLNEVVKDHEQKQPKIEQKNRMNTRAFIAGWDADEPEPEDSVKLQSNLLGQTQQCIYPWHPWQPLQSDQFMAGRVGHLANGLQVTGTGQIQSSAMLLQQCIYPWQQTPSGAILPLWYMNRNLEDM